MNATIPETPTPIRTLWTLPTFRALAVSSAVSAVGNGVFAASSFLYYTQGRGLGTGTVGALLTVTGVVAVLTALPLGRPLDAWDPGRSNGTVLVLQAGAVVGLALAPGLTGLVAFVLLQAVFSKIKLAARGALIGRGLSGPSRRSGRAWLRTLTNGGIGVGSAFAAVAVVSGGRTAYEVALVGVAVSYALASVPLWRLTIPPAEPEDTEPDAAPPVSALRDRRYVTVTAVSGLLGAHYLLITVGLPVWATAQPGRAVWIVSVALLLNTAVVALGQVPLSRPIRDTASACRWTAIAGLLFLVACAGIGLAGRTGRAQDAVVLVAVIVYSVGEVLQAAASWELSYALSPPARIAEYQGVFSSGLAAGTLVAPVAITTVLGLGDAGWAVLGAALVTIGALHLRFRDYPERSN